MAAINMNVTPPDISGGVLTLGPTSATAYTFSATVPVSSYQYTGNLSNASFFADTLTITSTPPKGTYGIVVDGIQPNATAAYAYTAAETTLFMDFPAGRPVVRNGDLYYANTFKDRIVRLPGGTTPPQVVAGNGVFPYNYADGTGTGANLPRPWGIAYDSVNDLFYFPTGNAIRRMVVSTGAITTVAGVGGTAGYSNAVGTSARFNGPFDPDFDATGNLIIAEVGNHRIRKISIPGFSVTLVAGSGTAGYLDSAVASSAQFNTPHSATVNRLTGDIYVSDTGNYCVRKITPAGVVSTLAGSNISGYADGFGTAARFGGIYGITWRSQDNCLYVADSGNARIRRITMAGVVTTFAGSGSSSPLSGGINQSSVIPAGGIGVDACGTLLYTANGGGLGGVGTVTFPGTEVRPSGTRPADYAIVATTNPVTVSVPSQIVTVVANPPIVNGVATLYKYSPFQYTFSNAVAGQTFTVTTTPELTPFVSIVGDTVSFSSATGFLTSYSSVLPISFNALFGSTVTDTLSFNVQVLPGRFFPPIPGSSNTFYLNEAISPILFQADISLTQIYSSPSLPPGLSFSQVDTYGYQYQLQGTPVVQSAPTTYNIVGRNTQTGRIVSTSNVYRVDTERIVVNVSPSSNISNMLVGTTITPRTVTALYPTYGSYSYQYRWTQVLPPGLRVEDGAGIPVVSGFSPTDLSSTIRIAGTPTLAAAQLFRTNNITSYPFTITANLTRGTSNLTASIPFTFSFAPTVLFTQAPSNVTLYLNDIIDPTDGYVFTAGTFFTPGTVNISSIFSPNLRSDLSLQFFPGTPESSAYLVSATGATYSEVSQPYIVRAVASSGLVRDTAVFITTQPDIVAFTPPSDLCSTFIFSRSLTQAKTGYYNSPINFRATATSGRTITYTDAGGTLAGTGLSLSNVTSNNSVRLVGTPTTTLPLTDLTIMATADQTFASATTTVKFSIVPDSATWTVTPPLPSPLELIQNVESTPYQFRATTLSGLPVAYYSSTNVPVGMNVSSTGRLAGTPTIAGSGVATVTANTGASALSLPVPYTVLPDAILFVTPSNLYPITPGQPIPNIPITAYSYSGIFGSNFTLDPSGNPTYGISVTSGGTIYGTAVQQIPPTLMYPAVPIPMYVSAVAGTVSGTFAFLLGTNNPGPNPEPYLYFSNQTGPTFPPQGDHYTFYQYASSSITVSPPPYPPGEFPYLYIHPGDLPDGLRFNGLTGVISGYPTELTIERAVTIHALQRTSQLVSSFTIYITVLNPFIVRPQTSAASYTALIRQYTLANAAQNSRDNRVFAGAERIQGAFAAAEGADVITQSNVGCDPNCPPVVVPVPGFSPLNVDGCALWLDAFDSAVVSGSNVLRWNDKSGGGHHATQIVGSPVYDASAINGYPAVVLDICASLYGSLTNTSVYASAFAVIRSAPSLLLDPSFGYHPILSTGRANGTADVTLLANSGAVMDGDSAILTERSGLVTDTEPNNIGPIIPESWYDGAVQYVGSDGDIGVYSNVSTGNFNYVRYGLGNNAGTPTLATLPWVGKLGEVLVYHNVLAVGDRQKVEGYLAWKWGLQGNLPSNHPYKNAPP